MIKYFAHRVEGRIDRLNNFISNTQEWSVPRRKSNPQRSTLNAAKMIDEAFAKPVKISMGGQTGTVSTFAAIVLQLTLKAGNDRRALRVLSRYRTYAAKRGGRPRMRYIFTEPPEENQK